MEGHVTNTVLVGSIYSPFSTVKLFDFTILVEKMRGGAWQLLGLVSLGFEEGLVYEV
jgi:hypothetical protein